MSVRGIQETLYRDLRDQERARHFAFNLEVNERMAQDVLDKALIKAQGNYKAGQISAPTYYRIQDRVDSLKKLRFTEEYEKN